MNEMLLQYLWNFKIFTNFNFFDTSGKPIEILDFGKWNHNSGPDFLMSKIKTNNLILAGNVELHVKSSDWIFHQHSDDKAFANIILHVVYHDDAEIEILKSRNVPTLELKNYIDKTVVEKYQTLFNESQFIACESIFNPSKIPFGFFEETLLKKLDDKAQEIDSSLIRFKNNYEAVLFQYLAYAFGLKVNAQIFKQLAEDIDFSIIQKICRNEGQLEALFFGKAGFLDQPEDEKTKDWAKDYHFLKAKFKLTDLFFRPKFMRLRPPNFPNLRLSQLATVYQNEQNLFSKIISSKSIKEISNLFLSIKASNYWSNHYNFNKISDFEHEKFLTKDFVNLILINCILPIKYAYHKNFKEEITDEILKMYSEINPERNSIIEGWEKLGVVVNSALESQALIFHHKAFCTEKKCLNCGIGFQLLKNN